MKNNMKNIKYFENFINESSSYEDYCDFGCNYISEYLEKNKDIDEDDFAEYVSQHNKADRDMGELQDISKEEKPLSYNGNVGISNMT